MKTEYWLPAAVFLGVSVPLVVLLNEFDLGGEYRVWISLGAGALATALVQRRLQSRGEEK